MQRDEKELDTQFTPNVHFWTPDSQIMAKALFVTDVFTLQKQEFKIFERNRKKKWRQLDKIKRNAIYWNSYSLLSRDLLHIQYRRKKRDWHNKSQNLFYHLMQIYMINKTHYTKMHNLNCLKEQGTKTKGLIQLCILPKTSQVQKILHWIISFTFTLPVSTLNSVL